MRDQSRYTGTKIVYRHTTHHSQEIDFRPPVLDLWGWWGFHTGVVAAC